MVESSPMRFSLYQENENGLSFWDLDLGPTDSTGHIYGYVWLTLVDHALYYANPIPPVQLYAF